MPRNVCSEHDRMKLVNCSQQRCRPQTYVMTLLLWHDRPQPAEICIADCYSNIELIAHNPYLVRAVEHHVGDVAAQMQNNLSARRQTSQLSCVQRLLRKSRHMVDCAREPCTVPRVQTRMSLQLRKCTICCQETN